MNHQHQHISASMKFLQTPIFLAITCAAIARSCGADCRVGDIMYREGDSMGHIGLECIDDSTYEGRASSCGPDSTIVEEEQIFACAEYCVQCGPRGRGAALCLSTPTTDRDCGEPDYFESNPIVCPDGQDPIPDTFCGRGPSRVDCADDQFCFIEPADRWAVCCPNPDKETCCDPEAYDSSLEWGSYCCNDGNWYAVDGSGGGNCNGQGLDESVACPPAVEIDVDPGVTLTEAKCCDPETGPGGCPDENGSFDRCWDEGGYCCSDGKWYADPGDGSGNCQDKQLEKSKACVESSGDAIIPVEVEKLTEVELNGDAIIPAEVNPADNSTEVKCCDPETGPGGCPDENGSFDRCWDEGGYCCSDGKWYADPGDGSGNCQDNQLEDSKACTKSGGNGAIERETTGEPVNNGGAAANFYFASCVFCLAMFACV